MLKYLFIFSAFPLIVLASSMPVGKCKYPLPSNPGLDISQIEGETLKYIYTPTSMVYKALDSISMVIRKSKKQKKVYAETIRAKSVFGTPTTMNFLVKDLGNGVLKKIVKKGEMSYIASIVAIKGDTGLLYVCSDTGVTGEDTLYVIARKSVDPHTVKPPTKLFSAAIEKFNFNAEFRKLPERLSIKTL
ncbi:uncharacterized protein LOC129004248 [Macrosteles quadrilineatus]|uniref:uncharacterized protein LOC129004234 n=1 Tax=Macrosteles quadrilineatus TaxID=74068 RepID=UPI0023E2F4A0|nr:uncharacterized protein LOC129004234 [Macrosteles quadrilineatus]XP_054288712.1 uncharacterized protein LOC129004248 [Macrosteles quadrilineatus]